MKTMGSAPSCFSSLTHYAQGHTETNDRKLARIGLVHCVRIRWCEHFDR